MGTKVDSISFDINDDIQTIGRKLKQVASEIKASVNQLETASGGLSQFDDRADIEVVFQGTSFFGQFAGGKHWAVQVYVFNEDSHRHVQLDVIYDGILGKIFAGGGKNSLNRGKGCAKRDRIEATLRS